jgi:hypothetical protein
VNGELPPEQVIAWLRSPEGETWSRERIAHQRDLAGSAPPGAWNLSAWHQRDPVYVPGLFSLREQAGYGDDRHWEDYASRWRPPPGEAAA